MENKTKDLAMCYPVTKRFQNLLEQIQKVLEKMGVIDKVSINTDLLGKAVIDYFEDIDRLKEFEGISRVNVDKIYSYETFWLLRRHPIQIIDKNIGREFWYINEKVCIAIMVPKMLEEMGIKMTARNPRFENFLDLMYYNFKYRIFTQQSLEFMVEAFFCGYSVKVSEVSNEQPAKNQNDIE